MSKFTIKMARIEKARGSAADPQICITFQIERGAIRFDLPIRLSAAAYDDTEMVQAARNVLHRTFVELAAQSLDWKRSAQDLQRLSGMSRRPTKDRPEMSKAKHLSKGKLSNT
jgi:hypothetical protein